MGKINCFEINSFFPAHVPILYDAFMFVSIPNDIFAICKEMVIVEWIREHEVLFMRIGSGTVLFLIVFLCYAYRFLIYILKGEYQCQKLRS